MDSALRPSVRKKLRYDDENLPPSQRFSTASKRPLLSHRLSHDLFFPGLPSEELEAAGGRATLTLAHPSAFQDLMI